MWDFGVCPLCSEIYVYIPHPVATVPVIHLCHPEVIFNLYLYHRIENLLSVNGKTHQDWDQNKPVKYSKAVRLCMRHSLYNTCIYGSGNQYILLDPKLVGLGTIVFAWIHTTVYKSLQQLFTLKWAPAFQYKEKQLNSCATFDSMGICKCNGMERNVQIIYRNGFKLLEVVIYFMRFFPVFVLDSKYLMMYCTDSWYKTYIC